MASEEVGIASGRAHRHANVSRVDSVLYDSPAVTHPRMSRLRVLDYGLDLGSATSWGSHLVTYNQPRTLGV
jgi:hypothetical protein